MRRFPHLFFGVLLLGQVAFSAAKPQVVLGPGTGGANFRKSYVQPGGSVRTLSKDTIYVMTGWYFVDSTAAMAIQAGTLILGDSASGGTLIIRRGGKIYAPGTVNEPIVFTSGKPAGTRRPGDWGGVIILGNATTNKPATQQIEGGFGTAADNFAMYGGPNADDSSGVLQYVRIEFAGIAFSQDNEINGLTFGGVGRKTVVDHIQVSFANDDDFEFFGGTVQAKYLVGWRSLDDCLDTDFGFSGKIQFAIEKRDPAIFDASASGSSNGFESDNEATAPYSATPRTKAIYCNISLIGPAADSAAANALNAKWDFQAMLRRSTELSVYNSILTGWRKGINIRDTLTQVAAMTGNLEIRNTSVAVPQVAIQTSSSPTTGVPPGFNAMTWFTTAAFHNNGSTPRQGTDLLPATAWNLSTAFDATPGTTSEPATAGTDYSSGRLSGDAFFTPVSYRGALDPTKSMAQQWTAGWTNFDPQGTVYVTAVEPIDQIIPDAFTLQQNYPNPFNPSTIIQYTVGDVGRQASGVRVSVYDMLGREVAVLVNEPKAAGTYSVSFNAAGLASGMYVYRLSAGNVALTRTMLLVK